MFLIVWRVRVGVCVILLIPFITTSLINNITSYISNIIITQPPTKRRHSILPIRNLRHYATLLHTSGEVLG